MEQKRINAFKRFAEVLKDSFNEALNESVQEVIEEESEQISKSNELAPGTIVKRPYNDENEHHLIIKREKNHDGNFLSGKAYRLSNDCLSNDFEVITPIEKPAQNGDKIIITNRTKNTRVGDVFVVTRMKESYAVIVNEKGSVLNINPSRYEIIERPVEEISTWRKELFENHGRKWNEFRRGDVVKHPYRDHFTVVMGFEDSGKRIEFTQSKQKFEPTEVIPVVFVNDRLDL